MDLSIRQLAAGAVRLAAMSQLGPLAGGLFLAGGAVAGKLLAESKWAETSAEMLMHLASDKASELFGSAAEGFRSGRNGDIEKSMRNAALASLDRLRPDAPPGSADWFDAWRSYLTLQPPAKVFAGAPGLDPVALEYDDDRFRELWWSRMEPLLAAWYQTERSSIAQMPAALAAFLRRRLPEALEEAHRDVLRDKELGRSWIAFQEHVYHDTLNHLLAIRGQLDRIERKLDAKLDGQAHTGTVWSIPRPTEHFQDRPDLIARIDAALDKSSVTALTALHGLGGIGKTQMARKFAELRRERYRLGVWIDSESEASLLASLSAVSRLMGWPPEQDQRALAARVINEISAREPYLVIFDNAESPAALRPWVERLSGLGHVLITSRHESWDAFARVVSVTQWSIEESARFLLERTGQSDRVSAEGLAGDLDGLVLALEHAAAYMLAGDGMALAEYRREWQKRLRWSAKGHDYPASVAAALGLSLDAVAAQSRAAYDLLCLFAWLAPDRIPRKELLEAGAAKLPEALAEDFADRDRWNETIETLRRYSLLRRERSDGATAGYFVHRVVQQVMRDRLAADGAETRWLAAACGLVAAALLFDPQEPGFWPACEALLPHARAIREHVRQAPAPPSLGRMLNQAGLYLRVRGLYAEARDFQELALESGVRQLGPDHPTVAIRRSNLANILGDLGEPAEARKQIELALESDLRQLGPDHPTVAIRRSNLANILRDLGELAEARKQIELALESDLRQFGPDHPTVAVDRSNLANILGDLGEPAEARKQIELALESDLRQFGPDHPTVAVDRSNLAVILSNLGEHQEARKQIELALESDLRQLGPDHPTVAVDRLNVAVILRKLGEHQEALKQIELALEIFRQKLPPGHSDIRNAEQWREAILRDAEGP